jgi:hypothetical protein
MAVLEELDRMSDERFLALYEALAQRGFGPLDAEVAKALKFRPQAIRKLPMETRARKARRLIEARRNAELCYELFGSYLVRTKKELVTSFLDATGVGHEDGMIADVEAAQPDPAKVPDAVRALDAEHPPEDVTLYLALCVEQWPDHERLAALWRERSGQGVSP